jgi:hypothetical protein
MMAKHINAAIACLAGGNSNSKQGIGKGKQVK